MKKMSVYPGNGIQSSIERIEAWFRQHMPEFLDDLNSGCDRAVLGQFEKLVGREFPDDLKRLYLLRNGQKTERATGIFYGLSFLPIERSMKEWSIWKEIIDSGLDGLNGLAKSARPGAVKEVYANRYWIPMAHDYGGNHFGVDLDPGETGKVGQVINFGRDEDEKFVLADTLDEFLGWFAGQLEGGNFEIRSDNPPVRTLGTKEPQSSHFLDSVRELFAEQRHEDKE